MEKELDPLRELDNAGKKEDSPPTVELSAEQKKLASETIAAASVEKAQERKSAPAKPNASAPAPTAAPTPTPSRQPTVQPTAHGSSRLRYTGHAVSIRENIAPREHIRLYSNIAPTITLFVLGIIVAVLGLGVYKGMTNPITPVSPMTSPVTLNSDPGAFPETSAHVEPLFGAYAVKRCNDRCDTLGSPGRELCQRGCNIYQLQVYGRRISFDKYDPVADANEILNRCTKREIALEMHTSGSAWSEDVVAAVALLQEAPESLRSGDASRVRSYYSRVLRSNQGLRLPPGGTPAEIGLTKELVQANCLAANAALVAVALHGVQQAADEVSARYYRDIAQSLEPKAFESGSRALAQSKALKLG